MKCPKCKFQNEAGDHFCGNCGGPLARHIVEKRGIPYWAVGLIALCCMTLGAVGFALTQTSDKATSTAPTEPKDPIVIQTPNDDEVKEDDPAKAETPKATPSQPIVSTSEPLDKITLIKQVSQKVFTIVAGDNLGTGFLYKNGGYVVTNAHVVQGFADVTVRGSDGNEYSGKVIGISDSFDIAIVQVADLATMEALPFENGESPVGLEVIAFGSPHGFENTASIGYITGTGRDMESDFVYNKLYQVDAQIDVGSSGGPLVDAKTGNVIGINSLVYTDNHSFAFSIPLYTMVPTLNEWIANPLAEEDVVLTGSNNDYADVFAGQEEEYFDFDINEIDIVENYISLYAEYYASALNEGAFFWVADMIDPNVALYKDVEKTIQDSYAAGNKVAYTSSEIVDITFEENTYFVTTNEIYDVTAADGTKETKDIFNSYTVVVDDEGSIFITNIEQLENIEQ